MSFKNAKFIGSKDVHAFTVINEAISGLSDKEIVAQGLSFISHGYEPMKSALSFLVYNMALNPDQQDCVIKEVDKVMGEKVMIATEF